MLEYEPSIRSRAPSKAHSFSSSDKVIQDGLLGVPCKAEDVVQGVCSPWPRLFRYYCIVCMARKSIVKLSAILTTILLLQANSIRINR